MLQALWRDDARGAEVQLSSLLIPRTPFPACVRVWYSVHVCSHVSVRTGTGRSRPVFMPGLANLANLLSQLVQETVPTSHTRL